MVATLKVTIQESASELKKRLSDSKTSKERERLQMLYWLKIGRVSTRKALGELLCRNQATVTRWLQKYRRGGLTELLEVRKAPGKPRKISSEVRSSLWERLCDPEGFNSYGEIQSWLEENYGVVASYKTVHKTVRYALGAKLKTPRPQSNQQDKEAQETFKKTEVSIKILIQSVRRRKKVSVFL